MYLLFILIFGTALGYDPRCPVQREWSLRAHVSCFTEDKYVCLLNILKKKYQADCSGSSQSSKGSKLVLQPVFNLAECNHRRYQPIVFTTYGNSECILLKSNCNEEGQTAYSNGSSSTDIACGCDYSQGYSFVIKPKNSCFCIPSEEDCTCFKVKCKKLSADYQCITDEDMIANTKCHEVYPQISFNQHNRTEQTINGIIKGVSDAHTVTYIIVVLLAACSGIVVIAILIVNFRDNKNKKLESARDFDYARKNFIHDLILNGECGKHHSARVVVVGKKGVGKTSLMRKLLWQNKEDVMSMQSTDSIEVVKCNINIIDGKWSPCDDIDDDLTRLIHQVYTEKNKIVKREVGEYVADNMELEYNSDEPIEVSGTEESRTSIENDEIVNSEIDSESSKSDEINTSISSMNQCMSKNIYYKEKADTDLKRKQQNNIKIQNEYDNNISNKANEFDPVNNADINKLTSTIMNSYLQRSRKELDDTMAFCWLWDFAGEKDFYATHQVFLSNGAVVLLVTDSLDFSTAEKPGIDFEDSTQYVNFWFDSIHCYWSTTTKGRLDPPIIVVCTNEDKVKEPSEQQKRRKQFEENLRKNLSEQKKKNHLREIYYVSNTEDNDDVFEEIRQGISRQAMQMNDWGRDCPLKWLLFQQVLGKIKESGVPISTTKQLFKIATHDDIGISNNKEFKLCLQYCHDNGTVIYFEEENLKDYVILDPKWLVDAFRCLVSDQIETKIKLSDQWENLIETGELTDGLIIELLKKKTALEIC